MDKPKLRYRERECKHCGSSFTYEIGPGRDRWHCTAACREAYKIARIPPKSTWPECQTDGCAHRVRAKGTAKCNACYSLERKRKAGVCGVRKCHAPATRAGAGLCEKHYYRVRRNGNIDLVPRVEVTVSAGYRLIKDASHPLTWLSGWVSEHRSVAYAKYGEGPHPCHWCGVVHEWNDLVVDHLNERKADNTPSNLVVACSPCNRARGAMISFIARLLPERTDELTATFEHMRLSFADKDSRKQSEERRCAIAE